MTEPDVMDLFRLDGRVAILTGGSRGLGKSMALGLAQAGATCVLVGRDEEVCQTAAIEVAEAAKAIVVAHPADVTDEAQVDSLVTAVLDRFGRVDVLINSAGVNIRHPIEDCPLEDFRRVMDTNLTGTWLCCRAVSRPMKEAGHGSVINLGSALSVVGLAERTPYCSSKAGVIGLTQTLALEWAAHNVRCNAICPGPFLTEMNQPLLAHPERVKAVVGNTALDRWAELHEIRGAALFLASDASTYVTGSALMVDGGWTAR